jgi:hypothetical protein
MKFSVLAFAVILSFSGVARRLPAQLPAGPDVLSVEQTVQAAYFGSREDPQEAGLFNIFSRANPRAKDELLSILQDKTKEQYFYNVLLMIGYIGEAKDATRIEELLDGYTGVLTASEKKSVQAAFQALGLMCRRRIEAACQTLEQMLTRDYWGDKRLRWRPANITSDESNIDETLAYALRGYAFSGASDMKEKYAAVLNSIDDQPRQAAFELRARGDLLGTIAPQILKEEAEPIGAARLNWLSSGGTSTTSPEKQLGAANSRSGSPNPSQTLLATDASDQAYVRNISGQAVDAYRQFTADVLAGNLEKIIPRLYDHDRYLTIRNDLNNPEIKNQAVPTLVKLLELDAVKTAKPINFEIRRETVYTIDRPVPWLPNQPTGPLRKTEPSIRVTFRLQGTENVGWGFNRYGETPTIDRQNGALIVKLEYRNGEWYWQPFGW